MLIMKNFLLFLTLLPALGCNKEPNPDIPQSFDYFIFGTAAGKCTGNCVTLYKLEGQNLYEDDNANYLMLSSQDIPFQATGLSAEKVALAETLQAQIPANLFNEPDGNIGCPDCYDQGMFYIKIKASDTVREWRIDRAVEEYTTYCDLIMTTLDQLK